MLRFADKIDIFNSYDDSVVGPFVYSNDYHKELNGGEEVLFYIKKTFTMSTYIEFLEMNDEMGEEGAFKLLAYRALCDSDGALALPQAYETFSEFLKVPLHIYILALFTKHLRETFRIGFSALSVEIEMKTDDSDLDIGSVSVSNRDAYGLTLARIDSFCDRYKCMPSDLLNQSPINYCVFLEGNKYREAYVEEAKRKRKFAQSDKASDAQADELTKSILQGNG